MADAQRNSQADSRVYLTALDRFGQCLGLAFQISDDLLDVEGQAGRTGKKIHKDAKRGKVTYPGLLGVSESRRRLVELCAEAERHLSPFGSDACRLIDLARVIVSRDR